MIDTQTSEVSRNTIEGIVRRSLRVADCLHTAMLIIGPLADSDFLAEAKAAERELREFINLPNRR